MIYHFSEELEQEFKKIFSEKVEKGFDEIEEIIASGHAENIVYGTGDREPKGFINATESKP